MQDISIDTTSFLRDQLINTVRDCTFAQSALTIDEEGQLNEAIDFLTDQGDGGIPVSSGKVKKYLYYKLIYEQIESI